MSTWLILLCSLACYSLGWFFVFQQGEYECKAPTAGAGLQGVCSLCSPQRRGPAQSRTPAITPNKVGGLSALRKSWKRSVGVTVLLAYLFGAVFVDSFSSLQHFLSFSCRVPAEVGGSLKPGAFPTCQPGSKLLKGEPESPLAASPTPSPDSPARSSCQPNSPAESNTCNKNLVVSLWRRLSTFKMWETRKQCMAKWSLFNFSRATSNPRRTQRRATGKNTSTSSSTLSVQPPRWRKKRWRSHKATRRPPQTGWARHPKRQQRRGLEKCLVRLIGKPRRREECVTLMTRARKHIIINTSSSDRGRPPATRVLAEPLPWGHPPLWITHHCLRLTRREQVRAAPPSKLFKFWEISPNRLFHSNCLLPQSHPAPISQKLHMQSSVRATMCPTVTLVTFKEPRPPVQVRLYKKYLFPLLFFSFLFSKPTPDAAFMPSQVTSRTAATCAARSSTDQPTWRLTLASTPGRSLTAATPVALGLSRCG